MATGDIAPVDSISQITNLLTLLNGKSQTSTTKSNISSEGMNALLQQILGGTQGLAAVAGGQKTAGLYNSTTNQQLTNDLITRASGELAKQQAGTTTVTSTPGAVSDKNAQYIKMAMVAKSLLSSDIGKKLMSKTGLSADASALWANITGESSVPASSIASANLTSDPIGSLAAELGWTAVASDNINTASNVENAASSVAASDLSSDIVASATGATASGASNYVKSSSDVNSLYSDAGYGATDTSSSFGSSSSSSADGGSILGYIGPITKIQQAYEGNHDYREGVGTGILTYLGYGAFNGVADKVARPISDGEINAGESANGIAGAFQAEPAGTVLSGKYNEGDEIKALSDPANLFGGNPGGSVEGFIQTQLDPASGGEAASNSWVICTELNSQGRLSNELYQASAKRALTLSPTLMSGYHYWAIPLTQKLRKSALLSCIFAYLAKSRCEHLLGKKRIWGWLSVVIGEPICYLIGKVVAKKDWKVLYG